VVDPERLDAIKQAGIYPSHIRAKGDYVGDPLQVPCTKSERHVGATQMFKIFYHDVFKTPCIKHHCPKTTYAAVLRACSNKVEPDDEWWNKFEIWFHFIWTPKFLAHVKKERPVIDMEAWLKSGRYTIKQQQALKESWDIDKRGDDFKEFKSFPKIELQFCNCPEGFCECKERQICGPPDSKKVAGNVFIWFMEGIAHKYLDEYCGRQNWMDICNSLDKWATDLNDPIYFDSDGSAFDITQLRRAHVMMNRFMMFAAELCEFKDPLSIEHLKRALDASLDLYVSADNGQLKYRAQGRASGDGWTTFANTILMICYWEFTFYMAEIPKSKYRLKVKGDDVLGAVEKHYRPALEKWVNILFTKTKSKQKHGLGQVCKMLNFGDITEMSFLSNHFFRTDRDKIRMTRIPARVFQTNSWSTKCVHDARLIPGLCYSKGMNLLAWGKGLPIWEVLGNKMVELGKYDPRVKRNEYSDEPRCWNGNDDRNAYMRYLINRFKMTEAEVVDIETQIGNIKELHGHIYLPALDKLYAYL